MKGRIFRSLTCQEDLFLTLLLPHDVYILCIKVTKIFMHGYGQIVLFSEETAFALRLWVFEPAVAGGMVPARCSFMFSSPPSLPQLMLSGGTLGCCSPFLCY